VSEMDFTPEQEAVIRARLGFRDSDREVTADNIVVVLEARGIVLDAERAWLEGEGG
jgi:hypothetical protein